MDPKLRIVVKLPLDELWDDRGALPHRRLQWLSVDEVREKVRQGPAQFVVADVGQRLQWIPFADALAFWRRAAHSIAPPTHPVDLEDYPDRRCCFAALWRAAAADDLVVLEVLH